MDTYKILKNLNQTIDPCYIGGYVTYGNTPFGVNSAYNLPIFLENKVDELGVLVGFSGEVEQVEQLVNFTYTISGNTVTVYGSSNTDRFRTLIEQNFTVKWGDGATSILPINDTYQTLQPNVSHTYTNSNTYNISVTLESPWTTETLKKIVKVPSINPNIIDNELGRFTNLSVPSYGNSNPTYLNYLNDLEYTNSVKYNTFRYLGIGGSKLSELKKYGEDSYSNITNGTDEIGNYTGYTFTYQNNSEVMILTYRDYNDGITLITGTTEGFTKEEIFNTMLTRNEHFLGFVEDPTIYSDVFIERGKQGVMEKNFRLSEIDNVGELEVYGNGYFNIRKQ
jgi:hypothetical protein